MTCHILTASVNKNILCAVLIVVLISVYTIYITPKNYLLSDDADVKLDSGLGTADMKYILQWTDPTDAPFDFLKRGREVFVEKQCKFTNCFVTGDRSFFKNETFFDAVIFNQKNNGLYANLPTERTAKQLYVFVSTEPSHYYPICDGRFNGFYNLTWSYKLNSDIQWRYFTIYDLKGNFVGPKMKMKWPKIMKPLNDEVKRKLDSKFITAGWFASNCRTKSRREAAIKDIERSMDRYNLTFETVGRCGSKSCSKGKTSCFRRIENYYFYFSFENSFSEDYVTEKLLNALSNFAVPVVFGGADYSRFLPPGSYLNARELGPEALAAKMYEISNNKVLYYKYHRWRNHFVYKNTLTSAVCDLCEALNKEEESEKPRVYDDIVKWWNGNQRVC